MIETISPEIEQLKEKALLHQVCYEVWPLYALVSEQKVKVGFELQLLGTHEHGKTYFSPGCERCVQTYHDLRQIAKWIMPKEERASCYEIEPFDNALHEAPKRRLRPEVALTIQIQHRYGFDHPIDECQERCLKEMEEKLAELGISMSQWRGSGNG